MTARKASVLKLKKDVALRCRWSPDGTAFVLGFDRKVVVYSAATSEPTGRVLKLKSPLQHMEMLTLKGVEYVVTSHSDGSIIFYPLDQITEEVKTEDSEELTTAKLPDSAFKVVGHAVRVKNFSFFHYEPTDVIYMSSVSSDGNLVIWDLNTRDQVAVYNTGDRLNCCVMVSEDVEHYEEMKKRARLDDVSEAEETDFSEAESEPEIKEELTANQKKKSKKRLSKAKKAAMSKKPKLTVELS